MGEQKLLVLDYESRSRVELTDVGAHDYAVHPSTEIICIAWRLGTRETLRATPTKTWSPFKSSPYGELARALCDPSVLKVAHNSFFEQVMTRFVLSRLINRPELKTIPPEKWICTAALAAALALPRKLEGACSVLELPHQKDMEGHKLMLRMAKPDRKGEWVFDEEKLARLTLYCARDVDAETELFLGVPPLSPAERELWELDQRINWRGLRVDRPAVQSVLRMVALEAAARQKEVEELTLGVIEDTSQRDLLLEFLSSGGTALPDLTKKTVEDALHAGMALGDSKRLLELRQEGAMTSTAKYGAFEARSRVDGRVRDHLVFHLAGTGRWGSFGLQIHNFPRGTIKPTADTFDMIREEDLDLIRLAYGSPLAVFSSSLRGMIIASEGKQLFSGDFSGIEARMVFWFAGHEAGLASFRSGADLYREMAAYIYRRPLEEITKGGPERQLGKKVILGAGFGIGPGRFLLSCQNDGLEIDKDMARAAVSAYRTNHALVPRLWSNLERAATAAIRNPGKKYTINNTSWWATKKFLWCELPSGRKLAYFGPEIRYEIPRWGGTEKRPQLYHWGVDPKTKQWVQESTWGGKLTENCVQAAARDVMAESMRRVEAAGFEVLFTVHDEVVSEKTGGELAEYTRLMEVVPEWATGLPLRVDSWTGNRYRKG